MEKHRIPIEMRKGVARHYRKLLRKGRKVVKMNKLKELWDWLDGKKTFIGAILHFSIVVIKAFQSSFGFSVVPDPVLNQVDVLADWIIGIGLAHKVEKRM